MKKISIIFCYIFIVLMLFYGIDMQAQTDPPPPPDGGGPGEVDDVPIDNYLIISLVAGLFLGNWVLNHITTKKYNNNLD